MWAGGNRRLEWASESVFTHHNKTMFTHNKEYTTEREGSGNIINPALMRVSKMGKLILINVWDEVRDYWSALLLLIWLFIINPPMCEGNNVQSIQGKCKHIIVAHPIHLDIIYNVPHGPFPEHQNNGTDRQTVYK